LYGTIAKMRIKTGAEPLLKAWFEGFNTSISDRGWLQTTLYRSDSDPQEAWMAVIFESREAYHANASSPNQDSRYRRLRSCLEADPEWHDGEVWSHSALPAITRPPASPA
jgi:heme-degrading monooxygenase HmoA